MVTETSPLIWQYGTLQFRPHSHAIDYLYQTFIRRLRLIPVNLGTLYSTYKLYCVGLRGVCTYQSTG